MNRLGARLLAAALGTPLPEDRAFPQGGPPSQLPRFTVKGPPMSEDMRWLGKALTGYEPDGLCLTPGQSPRLQYTKDGRRYEAVLMVMTTTEMPHG